MISGHKKTDCNRFAIFSFPVLSCIFSCPVSSRMSAARLNRHTISETAAVVVVLSQGNIAVGSGGNVPKSASKSIICSTTASSLGTNQTFGLLLPYERGWGGYRFSPASRFAVFSDTRRCCQGMMLSSSVVLIHSPSRSRWRKRAMSALVSSFPMSPAMRAISFSQGLACTSKYDQAGG
jgi:hypothetical protein